MPTDIKAFVARVLTGLLLPLFILSCLEGPSPPVSDEVKQELERLHPTAQLAPQASISFEQLVAGNHANPVAALVSALQAQPDVTTVEVDENRTALIVHLSGHGSFSLHLADQSRTEWQKLSAAKLEPQSLAPSADDDAIVCNERTFPQSRKACFITGFAGELKTDLGSVRFALQRTQFEVQSLQLASVAEVGSVRQTLSTCGVIYISSHGGIGQNLADDEHGNHVTTQIEYPADQAGRTAVLSALKDAFPGEDFTALIGFTARKGKNYITLSPRFFAAASYPNSLVFADVCQSAMPLPSSGSRLSLKDAFRQNGAGAFLGWDSAINGFLAQTARDEIFKGLTPQGVTNIDSIQITITPPDPGPGESYVPSASLSPAQADVELRLSISGTDGFSRTETRRTDATGKAQFASVPGGAGGVVDTISVVTGGAKNSATVVNVIKNSKIAEDQYRTFWMKQGVSVANLTREDNPGFNLICNNNKLAQTKTVIKF